jgi:4-amino-4-deoxy-L-arabinose transferase-like glycosyltransferase
MSSRPDAGAPVAASRRSRPGPGGEVGPGRLSALARRAGRRAAGAWALWAILAGQTALTIPWLWRTAPFGDEALYIDAGHQEWAHLLHHAPLADYARWFSGAPVLYPPLAAAADSAGGLAAARAISLVAMLGTTALVYLAGTRLFGRLAGFLAALLFAVCGLVVHYGAFATFGPPSLFLLALATWAAVSIRDGGAGWLPAAAVLLAAANATKYATLAWDPIVVGLVVLHGWDRGKVLALVNAASVALTAAILDAAAVLAGGSDYARGIVVTTVFRSIHWGAPDSADTVLLRALAMTGLLVVPAVAGVAIAALTRSPWPTTALLLLFAVAAVIGPADQARIHELSSLDKNIGYGLPFAAVGAGYALSAGRDWLARRVRWGMLAATAGIVAVVLAVVVSGRLQSVQFRGPAVSVARQIVAAISRHHTRGSLILSDGAARMEQYYLPGIPAAQWIGTFAPSARQRSQVVSDVCTGKVSVVVLRKNGAVFDHPYDAAIVRLLSRTGQYRLATVAGDGHFSTQVWARSGPDPHEGACS